MKKRKEKIIKTCYMHIPTSCGNCKHHVLKTCINKGRKERIILDFFTLSHHTAHQQVLLGLLST